mmetsp:Transcript_146235/g.255377  ORF Transcript_146235/g.255377 Transcript_146235/m.255377 type:complete len:202 (+) Transcript_146235:431-1036(+)
MGGAHPQPTGTSMLDPLGGEQGALGVVERAAVVGRGMAGCRTVGARHMDAPPETLGVHGQVEWCHSGSVAGRGVGGGWGALHACGMKAAGRILALSAQLASDRWGWCQHKKVVASMGPPLRLGFQDLMAKPVAERDPGRGWERGTHGGKPQLGWGRWPVEDCGIAHAGPSRGDAGETQSVRECMWSPMGPGFAQQLPFRRG